jgi:hypothetical protein
LKTLILDDNQIKDLLPLSELKLSHFSANGNPLKGCPKENAPKFLTQFCKSL